MFPETTYFNRCVVHYDRELGRFSFRGVACNQRTGKRKGVSTVAYLQNLRDGYIFKQILTDLVENVATIKQVEYLNLGVQLSGLGFDVIEG